MKSLGLTPAMRAALEDVRAGKPISVKNEQRLLAARLVVPASIQAHMETGVRVWVAPRGHSALAAPSMTRGEYEMMSSVDKTGEAFALGNPPEVRTFGRLLKRGWLCLAPITERPTFTPSGSKALNDMRAAEGSEEWKQ